VQDDLTTLLPGEQRGDVQSTDVEQRGHDEGDVVLEHVELVERVGVVPPEVRVGEHGALRRPVVPDVYMISATSSASTGSGASSGSSIGWTGSSVGLAVGQKSADRQIVSDRLDHLSVLRVGDEGVDACVADDEDQLRPGQAEVERHEDGAEARRCEHRLEERRLVQADEADPVAVAHATEAEMVCQTVDPYCISPYDQVVPSNVSARRFGVVAARAANQWPRLMSGCMAKNL